MSGLIFHCFSNIRSIFVDIQILFVVALPMSCLYGLFNSYVKSKFGIWRHLNVSKL